MPHASDLRNSVRVERRSQTLTSRGGLGAWETLITSRRCDLKPRKASGGAEQVIAARLQGVAVFDCWMRWDPETAEIRSEDRLVDRDNTTRVFNVRFAEDLDGRKKWLLLQLELGVAT